MKHGYRDYIDQIWKQSENIYRNSFTLYVHKFVLHVSRKMIDLRYIMGENLFPLCRVSFCLHLFVLIFLILYLW